MKNLKYYLKKLEQEERKANKTQESLLNLEPVLKNNSTREEKLWNKYIKARSNGEKYKEIIDIRFNIVL